MWKSRSSGWGGAVSRVELRYSPMQTGTLFYKTSRLLYDGTMVWERQDRHLAVEELKT